MNDLAGLTKFATRYAQAWSSHDPESVASFHAENGSLSVNDGPPAVGRAAIAEVARGFMRTFPDMIVTMDDVSLNSDGTKFHWTLTGTNTGPGGTGKRVRISGYELWKIEMEPAGAGRHGRESPRGLTSGEASQSTTDSSRNRKATSTARSTKVSSSTASMASAAD